MTSFGLSGVLERTEGWRSADVQRGGVGETSVDLVKELQCVEIVPSAAKVPWGVNCPWRALIDKSGDGIDIWRCTRDPLPVAIGEAGTLSGEAVGLIRPRIDVLLRRAGETACCALLGCNVATRTLAGAVTLP